MDIKGFIWGICDEVLRGNFKRHQYGDIILPFVVLRRLDCVIENRKEEIISLHKEYSNKLNDKKVFDVIHSKLNIKFSNTSMYDLNRLKSEPTRINQNLYDYLKSFSPNVQDIINNFKLDDLIEKLNEDDSLFLFIQKFSEIDLHPKTIDNHTMGSIYEELLNKFSEMSNETSGEHYTPRDVVELLVSLVFTPHKDTLSDPNKIIKLYDPCCGTGGMLTIGKEWVKKNINKEIDVFMYGQENLPQTYSICKSDFLISDEEPENIRLGNTLTNDRFCEENIKFDYMISNPPYGVSWKKEKSYILKESKDPSGRFSIGLPKVSDGQILFLQHMISKMETTGQCSRIGVVFNGSPLFTGDSGSGPSEIRKWIIQNDWLETIIQLPNQLFFNTGIPTYFWIVTNKKSEERKGKIQLIDGSDQYELMRKSLGKKRKLVNEEHLKKILNTYMSFKENEISQIFNNEYFGYTKVQIEQPLFQNGELVTYKNGKPKFDTKLRDHERIPLNDSIDEYFLNEVKPYVPKSWMDRSKDKTGYEINFKKEFFEYKELRKSSDILEEIMTLSKDIEIKNIK